jgi:hypothetical protein
MGRLEDLTRGAQVDGIRPDGLAKRWLYGGPRAGNGNFAGVQPFVQPSHPPRLASPVRAGGAISSGSDGGAR